MMMLHKHCIKGWENGIDTTLFTVIEDAKKKLEKMI